GPPEPDPAESDSAGSGPVGPADAAGTAPAASGSDRAGLAHADFGRWSDPGRAGRAAGSGTCPSGRLGSGPSDLAAGRSVVLFSVLGALGRSGPAAPGPWSDPFVRADPASLAAPGPACPAHAAATGTDDPPRRQ